MCTREDLACVTQTDLTLLRRLRSFTMVRTHDSRDTEDTTDRLIQYSDASMELASLDVLVLSLEMSVCAQIGLFQV